jgi:hypothetical protein
MLAVIRSHFFTDRMILAAMEIELSLCCLSGWLPLHEWGSDSPSTLLALAGDHSP